MDLTEGWALLRDRYYRKLEIYDMAWEGVDFVRNKIVGGQFGGPLAVTRDDSKIQKITSGSLKPTMDIFTSSGKKLSSFLWEKGRIVKMAWDDIERLIVVLEDGSVILYSVFGEPLRRFTLDRKEIKDSGILDAMIWSSGLVCLTKNLQFFCMMNFDDPYIVKLKDPGLDAPPTCWSIIEPQLTENSSVQVLVGTQSGTILAVDVNQVQDMLAPNGPFIAMSVSPTGKILACFTQSGNVWVVSTDFAQNLSTFETKSPVPPTQLVWCGVDAVVCYWGSGDDHLVFVIGPLANFIKYTYHEPVTLVSEPDGIRIISAAKCELLQRVPNSTEAIFRTGSKADACTLYEAFEAFEKNSPQSDELIRSLGEKLTDAVDKVVDAASLEFDMQRQKSLLHAASLGKAFRDFYPSDKFVEVCKTLRILNQVRDYRIGMPLTYPQYKLLTAPLLMERLLSRRLHYLAFEICEYLGLKSDNVLIHWACTKVKATASQLPDDDGAQRAFVNSIVSKLSSCPGISYAEVASTAYKTGKARLATMLLDFEPRAQDQVPLLISMKQPERALEKAIQSGDSDLVHLVILHLRRGTTREQFFNIISKYDVALNLYIQLCKEQDLERLKEVFDFQKKADLLAFVFVKEAYETEDLDIRKDALRTALGLYKKGGANSVYASKATEEQIGLLLLQRDLEASLGGFFVGSSLSQTIYRCILMRDHKRASKIRNDFKVPDNRYYWLKVKALGELGDFAELEAFAKEKKPPIGYKPFADVCIEHNNLNEAIKYIKKISEADVRARLYIQTKQWKDAFISAKEAKSPNLLVMIRNNCKDPGLVEAIEQILRAT